jgi:hypothetical protein
MIAASLHDARVHRKPFAFDEAHRHRCHHDAFKDMAQNIALTEAVQPILRERRVVGNLVVKIELAEPTVA